MARSTPSLLALLGLVAVAGYQNRGKISDMLKESNIGGTSPNGQKGPLSDLGDMFGSSNIGSTISSGLKDLMGRFDTAGHGSTVNSWVAQGPNTPVQTSDLETALGDETLADLQHKTGLDRAELLKRLSAGLPDTVNALTPAGRPPTAAEVSSAI